MPDSYAISFEGTLGFLGWDSHNTHVMPLDATHSLCVGYTQSTGGQPIKAVVVEHSTPTAPTVGTPVTVSTTATSGGADFDVSLAPDGVTIAWATGRSGAGFAGVEIAILTWNGAMGLTLDADSPTSDAGVVDAAFVCMPANDRVFVACGVNPGVGLSFTDLYSWSGGVLAHLDSGPSMSSPPAAKVYPIDSTHALIWEFGGVELVDLTGDVVTLPAFSDFAADFPANVQSMGVRPKTTDPTVFRGYTTTAGPGATSSEALYTVNVGALTITPSAGPAFTGPGVGDAQIDVDGVTSLGIDVPGMVVAGVGGSISAAVLTGIDYASNNIGTPTTAGFAGGALDWPTGRVRNVGDGLLYVSGDGDGFGSSGFVALYEMTLVPGAASGLVWGVIPLG